MAQRFCEVCSDPLPLEAEGTMCDTCIDAVDAQMVEINEELGCETPAPSVADSSSSVMPDETSEEVKSTSESSDVLDVTGGMEFESPDSRPDVKKKVKPTLPCEACGTLQTRLNSFKHPAARESIELCDKCFEAEKAVIERPDDPMQGKVVHPDEADREEVISMDQEDAELYNREVLISMESPIEEVYARISLLEGKLQRAKLLLRASKSTLFMRIEHMKKDEREVEYRRLNDLDAKKRSRRTPARVDGSRAAPRKASTSRKPARSKAQVMREHLASAGFPADFIEAQIKKAGFNE